MFSPIYIFRHVSAAPLMSFNQQIYVKDMILLPSYLMVDGSNANPDGICWGFRPCIKYQLKSQKGGQCGLSCVEAVWTPKYLFTSNQVYLEPKITDIVCFRGLYKLHSCDPLCPQTLEPGQERSFEGKKRKLKESLRRGVHLPHMGQTCRRATTSCAALSHWTFRP